MARHKEFEINEVLDKAMYLFWSQGYEKTSMQELVDTMGIHRRSIYDTFGDKHALFIQALQRYQLLQSQRLQHLLERQVPVTDIIRIFLETTVDNQALPKGCLMVNSGVELGTLDPEVSALVEGAYTHTEQCLLDLLVAGQGSGEIQADLDAELLAHYFMNAWLGLRTTVKTAVDQQKLTDIIDTTLRILNK
ncbi:HTH-type transcriptional repressor ComR [Paenibacillus nuruki]|uniref:HTH-type transcriptional repressor ComR n=1 Tax=Paenibacillus nuruki TaxID=1886670 RepID=A0A1E3L0C9_9BACL|nr:TetR/AcrR family transcriptional regulator [Paenibacillus nuruki]ODP27248.1 HTH-type transcriptional repressor ComR [Paenibacillus nuruki]CAJ1314641.1 HTH-type transcriptional repressor ComR [Paenibacillus nuruki]